ncbi:MAG: DUF362 domain-containing protein [Candidatus Bathyarchaeia archaeon]
MSKKGRFHRRFNESIADINLYLKPSYNRRKSCWIREELNVKPKDIGVMIFSNDLVAADAVASSYIEKDSFIYKAFKARIRSWFRYSKFE